MNGIRIVLPEGDDERVHIAAKMLMADHPEIHPILIGNVAQIKDILGESDKYTVMAPEDEGKTLWQAAEMVKRGSAEGVVAGAAHTTSDVLRAYIKTIGTEQGVTRVTSCFLMEKGLERYIFADCAVNIEPSPEILAETAYLCNKFAKTVNLDPKVAFLSFSTKGSAEHAAVDKVRNAVELCKKRYPDLIVDGELQVDAAIVPRVTREKAPNSPVGGNANVLIFPDLNSGNIAYKIAERFGKFKATGPILLGLQKPAHDLSRGCSPEDIVSVVLTAAKQHVASVAHETK